MVSAFVAATDAAVPKIPNLCDRIKCDTTVKVPVCGSNGNYFKAFENACEMRLHNCNKGQRKIFVSLLLISIKLFIYLFISNRIRSC